MTAFSHSGFSAEGSLVIQPHQSNTSTAGSPGPVASPCLQKRRGCIREPSRAKLFIPEVSERAAGPVESASARGNHHQTQPAFGGSGARGPIQATTHVAIEQPALARRVSRDPVRGVGAAVGVAPGGFLPAGRTASARSVSCEGAA